MSSSSSHENASVAESTHMQDYQNDVLYESRPRVKFGQHPDNAEVFVYCAASPVLGLQKFKTHIGINKTGRPKAGLNKLSLANILEKIYDKNLEVAPFDDREQYPLDKDLVERVGKRAALEKLIGDFYFSQELLPGGPTFQGGDGNGWYGPRHNSDDKKKNVQYKLRQEKKETTAKKKGKRVTNQRKIAAAPTHAAAEENTNTDVGSNENGPDEAEEDSEGEVGPREGEEEVDVRLDVFPQYRYGKSEEERWENHSDKSFKTLWNDFLHLQHEILAVMNLRYIDYGISTECPEETRALVQILWNMPKTELEEHMAELEIERKVMWSMILQQTGERKVELE